MTNRISKIFNSPIILLGFFAVFLSLILLPTSAKALTKTELSISFSPAQAKIGDTITINMSVASAATQNQLSLNGQGLDFEVGICNSVNDLPSCAQGSSQLTSLAVGKNVYSAQLTYKLGTGPAGSKLVPGQSYTLGGDISSGGIVTGTGLVGNIDVVGLASTKLIVSAAANTGQTTLGISEVGQVISGGVNKQFSISYLDGGTAKTIASLAVDCDSPNKQNPTATVAPNSKQFTCLYPYDKKNYQVVITAVLSDGTTIKSPTTAVAITGQERATGATNTGPSSADLGNGLLSFINKLFGSIIAFFQYAVYFLFSFLVVPLLEGLLQIHTYTDTFAAVIYPGWIIVRNICNIFFIVALIIIAMATLFRIESYQFRQLLVKLIIAALLVNFSLVIGQAVLGIADTMQNQFLPNSGPIIRGLGADLMVSNTQTFFSSAPPDTVATFADTVKPLFLLALTLGSAAVFVAILAFLFIRIVALWVLLLVSPAAYAAGALPATEHWRKDWWGYFLKYAFFTPVMAFFLNITALVANTQKNNPLLQQISSANFNDSSVAAFAFKVGSNVILLIFLLAAIKVAEGFGVIGADFMGKMVKGGLFAPFAAVGKGSKSLGSLALRGYSRIMGTKAFEAVQEEVKAKQALTSLDAARISKQKELDAARAQPNPDQAQIEQLEEELGEITEGMHGAHKAEKKAARKKMGFGLAQFLNPIAVKKGWEARKHLLEERAYKPAEGSVHDMLNRYMPTEWGIWYPDRQSKLGRVTDYGFVDKLAVIREEAKHLENLSINRNFAVYAMDNAVKTGGWEEKLGQALLINKQNQQDDVGNVANDKADYVYNGYNDMMYLKNDVFKGMPKAAQEVVSVQILEQQEADGRGRAMFFDEGTNTFVGDLSHIKTQQDFKDTMAGVIDDYRKTKDDELVDFANQMEARVAGGLRLNDIVDNDFNPKQGASAAETEFNRHAQEAIVSSRIARIYGGKQMRGDKAKWMKSYNPAEVRDQTPDGWTRYNDLGVLKMSKTPDDGLEVWLRRPHQGENRTKVYGGAMVDPKTKIIRMPRSPRELQAASQLPTTDPNYVATGSKDYNFEVTAYRQLQRIAKFKPIAPAVMYASFHHPNTTTKVLDEVKAGRWGLDPAEPEVGIKIVNADGTFGARVNLDDFAGRGGGGGGAGA